ncbi:paired box protein and transposase domain containing protein-like protein [Leptotrombidium deliense]|uniref:Paired box protein and transposase domain containing protein-like protein n=1 Tax=Leptotrombidium deliense TaxID=299467 RepID=A0A443RZZ4_9ACAR|nr:paired box protein and transposase domain containing protein-like protein [Leptotrombidium deliense]
MSSNLSMDIKKLIVKFKQQGLSNSETGRRLGIAHTTVAYWFDKFTEDNDNGLNSSMSGRQKTHSRKRFESNVVALTNENPFLTAPDLKQLTLTDYSERHVRRILLEKGLGGHIAARKPILNDIQKLSRYYFAQENIDKDWSRVLFTDEKIFQVGSNGVIRVRRPKGTRFEPKYVAQKHTSGYFTINVWGMISSDGGVMLKWLKQRNTSQNYLKMLQNEVFPLLLSRYGVNFQFQQDNAAVHTANIVKHWMQNTSLTECPKLPNIIWPVKSADMSIIENVWGLMEQRMINIRVSNKDELWCAVNNVWNETTSDFNYISTLYQSIPNRMSSVVELLGEWTHY